LIVSTRQSSVHAVLPETFFFEALFIRISREKSTAEAGLIWLFWLLTKGVSHEKMDESHQHPLPFWVFSDHPFMSLKLKVGSLNNPEAGFAPFLASLLLLFLSAVILIKDFLSFAEADQKVPFITWKNLMKPINLMGALIGYGLLFTTLGYVTSTFLLMLAMFIIYECKKVDA